MRGSSMCRDKQTSTRNLASAELLVQCSHVKQEHLNTIYKGQRTRCPFAKRYTSSSGELVCIQELNARATHLLFRDKRRHLHLYNIAKQERTTLLPYCSYVQWVPGSDVVVAQSRSSLCVWYSINAPDQQTVLPIKGDVENIERTRVG